MENMKPHCPGVMAVLVCGFGGGRMETAIGADGSQPTPCRAQPLASQCLWGRGMGRQVRGGVEILLNKQPKHPFVKHLYCVCTCKSSRPSPPQSLSELLQTFLAIPFLHRIGSSLHELSPLQTEMPKQNHWLRVALPKKKTLKDEKKKVD